MKAVVCSAFGLENAAVQDVTAPEMTADGVRIAVSSAGVSFANLLVIEGKHQNRWEPPFTPGTEVAGVVTECGQRKILFQVCDRVAAGVRTGGYAQEVVAPEPNVFRLPDAVDFDAAVHFPTIYATAYAALKWKAAIQPDEVLLVHGAAGGSGLAAVEIGKQLGARVIATAGNDDKTDAACTHGADLTINYRQADIRDVVLEATAGRGADVIFDPVGGSVSNTSLRCIAPEGRIIPMGFASGKIPQIPANILLVKNATAIGLYWGYYMGWARQAPAAGVNERVRGALDELLGWAATGKLRPRTSRTFNMADFAQALNMLSSREVIGRVALHP
jgi:NADPH2:quinone reductase